MSRRGEVLVAVINQRSDLDIAREQRWYRIPVSSVERRLKDCWPPQRLAFYQTKAFGKEAYAVNYYARVLDVRQAVRRELFPAEPNDEQAAKRYYQLMLTPLEKLRQPILSRRLRRIIFIPTTLEKLSNAIEINDLYHDSPLEDRLWAELKRRRIQAERQEYIEIEGHNYALDFAIYCATGKLAVETDGDLWHVERERAAQDNVRDNDLETAGWSLLRFTTKQINEEMTSYCVLKIAEKIKGLGGLEGQRRARPKPSPASQDVKQLNLFDETARG
jgi:very-short-patch-repair endonuclease